MGEDRNFRYFYYEKVGFRGVEEKKSLDILLKEKPNDFLPKLSQFTQRFQLPKVYRKLVWSLLLDIIEPNCDENDDFVAKEQRSLCVDLRRALDVMLLADDNTTHDRLVVLMYFLESDQLDANHLNKQLEKCDVMDLLAIADTLTKEFIVSKVEFSLEDTYWIFRNFVNSVRSNFSELIETYEKFISNMAQDDQNLHCHLVKTGVIVQTNTATNLKRDYKKYNILPYRPIITWFVRFYAGIVHHNSLIRILDKLIGALIHGTRPFIVLTLVGKAILSHSRSELLELSSHEEITKRLLAPLTFEQSEQVITKALSP